MKAAAVALLVAAFGFYANVAWAGGPSSTPAPDRPAAQEPASPLKRPAPAATPAPKADRNAGKVPQFRMPERTGREVICACGRIDRHA